MVINYEIPSAPEDYVHRIGRTGRAGASGIAISLVSPEEEKYLKEIEKLIKREIPKEKSVAANPSAPSARAEPSGNSRPRHGKKPADDWFSRPYEPAANTSLPSPQASPSRQVKSNREVPALLGGLRRQD
jgi:ATP-dependent RNA helicase RhlE